MASSDKVPDSLDDAPFKEAVACLDAKIENESGVTTPRIQVIGKSKEKILYAYIPKTNDKEKNDEEESRDK